MNTDKKVLTRRFRKNEVLRDLIRENVVIPLDLIWPIFVKEGIKEALEVNNMPNVFQYPIDQVDQAIEEVKKAKALGIKAVVYRPIPEDFDNLIRKMLFWKNLLAPFVMPVLMSQCLLIIIL